MNLKVGDVIVGTNKHNEGIVKQITEVRPAGYSWVYPDIPDKDFLSENSNDPHFEVGWEEYERATGRKWGSDEGE